MLDDIRSGRINLILVTEISRLSRNNFDFSSLIRELDQCRAKLLSVKEQFDTSTPAGEMMVNFMVTLAQFERKQTSERVKLNFHSRALHGLRNGSRIILGYDPVEGSPGKYAVNEEKPPSFAES
jgi:site-specific DNA recombinase